MEWNNAGGWLMDHNAPAPYTPDGLQNEAHSVEDADYDLYLDNWIRRVQAGDMAILKAPEWTS